MKNAVSNLSRNEHLSLGTHERRTVSEPLQSLLRATPPDALEVAIKHRMDVLFSDDPCLVGRPVAVSHEISLFN
jgi:hypothetical protein